MSLRQSTAAFLAILAACGEEAESRGRGVIELGGELLDDPSAGVLVLAESRRVGVVFQDYLLFPHLSVLENVTFGPRSRGMSGRNARARAREWLERLELEGMEARRPRDVSGARPGVRPWPGPSPPNRTCSSSMSPSPLSTSRTAPGRSTCSPSTFGPSQDPRLLPTEAFLLADEIHVLEAGRVTQSGTADDICLRPRTRSRRTGGRAAPRRSPFPSPGSSPAPCPPPRTRSPSPAGPAA